SVGWTLGFGALDIGHLPQPTGYTWSHRLGVSVRRMPDLVLEMVGVFGWLDTPSPPFTYLVWGAVVGALALAGLAGSGRRSATLMVGVIAATLLVPMALEALTANRFGFGWQGRYTLPLAIGVPVLAGYLAGRSRAIAE